MKKSKKKCKHKKDILASAWISTITPDEEPYQAGEKVEMEDIELGWPARVSLHYCAKCDAIIDIRLEPS